MSESIKVSDMKNNLCIICQRRRNSVKLTSTEQGRERLRNAANSRRDIVFERLKLFSEDDKCFFFYLNNSVIYLSVYTISFIF